MMVEEHYFSSDPAAPKKTVSISIKVGGLDLEIDAASGTFSSSRLDAGTAVLLRQDNHFPKDGKVLDLGCGWGPIGLSIAAVSKDTEVYGVDINQRSIEQSNLNAKKLSLPNYQALHAKDLPSDLRFSAIWSNPPIRVGKKILHQLMETYIPRLEPGGKAMLVVQKNLGADSFQRWLTTTFPEAEVTRVATDKGYRIISLVSPPKYPSK
jgi:16S rRNA (guanine1207-N2)-methyltransferase